MAMGKYSEVEIKGFIKATLSELLNISTEEISDTSLFVEELGVSSIMVVELFVSIEEKYGVDMQSRFNLGEAACVNSIADKIKDLLQEKSVV